MVMVVGIVANVDTFCGLSPCRRTLADMVFIQMTLREDAARMYAKKICVGLPYKSKPNPRLAQFIVDQEVPKSSDVYEHKDCWRVFFRKFDERNRDL